MRKYRSVRAFKLSLWAWVWAIASRTQAFFISSPAARKNTAVLRPSSSDIIVVVPRKTRTTATTIRDDSWMPHHRNGRSSTRLFMVFDFFRERSKEGLDQLSNLSTKAQQGKLGQGLVDVMSYTQQTNQAFALGLAKSRNRLLQDLESLLTTGAVVSPEQILDELQDLLLQADLGARTAEDIIAEIQSLREDSTKMLSKDDLKSILRGKLMEALETGQSRAIRFQERSDVINNTTTATTASGPKHMPTVLFVMGANGMGKTTTIGKLAYRLQTEGNQTVLLAACDTFRAAAVDQLRQWAERTNATIVGPTDKVTTPAAVLYAALDQAIADKVDTVLVDTSGRLSNNDGLTQELVKMKRVIQKRLSVATNEQGQPIPNEQVPHETLLVLDAAQGRMALDSARVWDKALGGLTGLILTKLDGSARGGSVVAVSRELGLPVKLIGVGEGLEDLRDFEPESFVDGLLGIGVAGGKSGALARNEGAMLASRLVEMRQERERRAQQIKIAPAMPPEPVRAAAMASSFIPQQKTNRPKSNKNKKRKSKS